MRHSTRFVAAASLASAVSVAHPADNISIVDYCDPADPAWAPTGGCLQKDGDVTLAEFNALLHSGPSGLPPVYFCTREVVSANASERA
jgi:hypothetical protein